MSEKIPPNFLFPTNFRNRKNVKRLIKDFNVQGYGIALYLLETLAGTEGHKYPLSDIDLLADEMKVSIPVIQTVLKSYGIFEFLKVDEDMFFSSHLNQWLEPYYKQVEQRKTAGQISAMNKKIKQQKQLKNLLSQEDSIQRSLNGRSTNNINKEIKEINNLSKLSLDFKTFKQELLKTCPEFRFLLQGELDYTKDHLGFCFKNGYIFNIQTNSFSTKEDSFKIWNYLFNKQDKVLMTARSQQEEYEKIKSSIEGQI